MMKKMVTLGKTVNMFDRAEALQNTAKAIKGLKALDDDALETLYAEAKAERRARERAIFVERVNQVFDKRFTDDEQFKMSMPDEMNERKKIEEELKKSDLLTSMIESRNK